MRQRRRSMRSNHMFLKACTHLELADVSIYDLPESFASGPEDEMAFCARLLRWRSRPEARNRRRNGSTGTRTGRLLSAAFCSSLWHIERWNGKVRGPLLTRRKGKPKPALLKSSRLFVFSITVTGTSPPSVLGSLPCTFLWSKVRERYWPTGLKQIRQMSATSLSRGRSYKRSLPFAGLLRPSLFH